MMHEDFYTSLRNSRYRQCEHPNVEGWGWRGGGVSGMPLTPVVVLEMAWGAKVGLRVQWSCASALDWQYGSAGFEF